MFRFRCATVGIITHKYVQKWRDNMYSIVWLFAQEDDSETKKEHDFGFAIDLGTDKLKHPLSLELFTRVSFQCQISTYFQHSPISTSWRLHGKHKLSFKMATFQLTEIVPTHYHVASVTFHSPLKSNIQAQLINLRRCWIVEVTGIYLYAEMII